MGDFDVGITIEGWQEYHDEACLIAQNNKYNDGVAWHDVACHTRSVIVCEDSEQLMQLVKSQNNEDVKEAVKQAEEDRQIEIDSILANEVEHQDLTSQLHLHHAVQQEGVHHQDFSVLTEDPDLVQHVDHKEVSLVD